MVSNAAFSCLCRCLRSLGISRLDQICVSKVNVVVMWVREREGGGQAETACAVSFVAHPVAVNRVDLCAGGAT